MRGGYCVDCREWVSEDLLMVDCEEAGSGPGQIWYACIPHARTRATWPHSPDWLRADVAALDGTAGDS